MATAETTIPTSTSTTEKMETDPEPSTTEAQPKKPGGKVNRKRKKNQLKQIQPNAMLQLLLTKLKTCKKGDELNLLMETVQPSINELVQKHSAIKKDLEKVMIKANNRNYEVLVFGSAVTGLAFKDSDFDFFINCGSVSNKDTSIKMINKLSGVITKFSDCGFRQPIRITGARVPILRVHHVKSGIVCDINFFNSMGVYNSAFLNFVLNFHPLIHPLAIIIKFWTRCQGPSFKQLNTYCIVNMLIYYLQQLKVPLLPPIIFYQQNIPENQLGAWNFAWNTDFPSNSKNKSDVYDLLMGFFKFYSSFAYERFVVCPLYAKVYPRQQFESNFFEDNEQARYKYAVESLRYPPLQLKAALCIQDPFELNANIGKAAQTSILEFWKMHCRFAAKLCEDFLNNRTASTSTLLTKLFTETPSLKAGGGSLLPMKQPNLSPMLDAIEKCGLYSETPNEYYLRTTPLGQESYVIKQILLKTLTANDPERVLTQLEINEYWATQLIKFLLDDFFVQFFGFTVEKLDYQPSGQPKVIYSTANKTDEEQSQEALAKARVAGTNESVCHVFLYRIVGETDSWSGRKKILFTDIASLKRELESARTVIAAAKARQVGTIMNAYLKVVCGTKYEFASLEFYDCVGVRKRSGLKTFFKNILMRDWRACLKGRFSILQAESGKPSSSNGNAK